MSATAKATLAASCVVTTFVIWGVYSLQKWEAEARVLPRPGSDVRQTMYKGVVRDAERRKEKAARAAELDEQAVRRAFLERSQPVSNPSAPAPPLPAGLKPQDLDNVRFDSCKTC